MKWPVRITFCSEIISCGLVLVSILATCMWSSTTALAQTGRTPVKVEVGTWFAGIHDINIANGSVGVEFYIWWISPDASFRPFQEMQILNGRNWSVKSVSKRQLADGRHHTSGIVSATISHDWQLKYFPFDAHNIEIIIETSSTASEIIINPNTQKSALSQIAKAQGYKLINLTLRTRIERYATDFGIDEGMGNKFSRLIISLNLERDGGRLILIILIGFIVANIITLLTYSIHISNLSIRVAICGGAIFCAVGNMYYLSGIINPAAKSILIDRFAIGTFAAIIVALGTAIIVDRLCGRGKSRRAHRFNRLAFYAVLLGSISFYGYTIMQVVSPGADIQWF